MELFTASYNYLKTLKYTFYSTVILNTANKCSLIKLTFNISRNKSVSSSLQVKQQDLVDLNVNSISNSMPMCVI